MMFVLLSKFGGDVLREQQREKGARQVIVLVMASVQSVSLLLAASLVVF